MSDRTIHWASRGDGGHLIIESDDWSSSSIYVINTLVDWSKKRGKSLRIIGHFGSLRIFKGADGRNEFVGDDINLVGKLASLFDHNQIYVTSEFVDDFDCESHKEVLFHNPFEITPEYLINTKIYFCSIKGTFKSAVFSKIYFHEKAFLKESVKNHDPWKIIHSAKRLMQLNSDDKLSIRSIEEVNRTDLSYVDRSTGEQELNPFIANLTGPERVHFVRASQLVERHAGEVLCEFGDEGDTMYLILTGAVAVIDPESQRPLFILKSGEIIGELACALRKRRTATLMCVGSTSLLSFNLDTVNSTLNNSRIGKKALEKISQFLNDRVARYICLSKDFFIGKINTGPLARSNCDFDKPWEHFEEHEIIKLSGDNTFFSTSDEDFVRDGIYILLDGAINDSWIAQKEFSEESMPLIHCNIPRYSITPFAQYELRDHVSLMRISSDSLAAFGKETRKKILYMIDEEAMNSRYYDIFLSYSLDDEILARKWKQEFEKRGYNVYMDKPKSLGDLNERIEAAIKDSLAFVVLISKHSSSKDWLAREVDYRRELFDQHDNVFPVRLPGGEPEEIVDGKAFIDMSTTEKNEAIEQVLKEISQIKKKKLNPRAFDNKQHLKL